MIKKRETCGIKYIYIYIYYIYKYIYIYIIYIIYFLSGFSFYSTLPLPPAYKHWNIHLQLCMWDDYHVFLIAALVFARLLLNGIYHLIELPFHWLIDWLIDDEMFVCLLDEVILGFSYNDFDMGNRWIWTRIDYHPCITSQLTNQMC